MTFVDPVDSTPIFFIFFFPSFFEVGETMSGIISLLLPTSRKLPSQCSCLNVIGNLRNPGSN